jgi:alpha-L-fucosidase
MESVKQHQVPDWYHDAKLGIFIHWGLYSVPGWAPHGGDIDEQVREKGWAAMFANNPYAEWYLNTLRHSDTPTRRHHIATYGPNFSYDDFAPDFNKAVEGWDAESWASLFAKVGARYVVPTTKHHDGFLLWPSARTSPKKPGRFSTSRDLIGDLATAARRHNMRVGLYYSGGLDWSFNETPVRDFIDVYSTIVQSQEFIDYADFHWNDLIERYRPDILWNDIGFPAAADAPKLFAHYYNSVPDGLINDRWAQKLPDFIPGPGEPIGPPHSEHSDYTTPEYGSYDSIRPKKWESCRGIGHSFGYNQNEGPDDYISVEKLVRMFVDVVSKNGNLLLDVGPMADGTIPDLQVERLTGLGDWLAINGDAIFGTRPWVTASGKANSGNEIDVRFTQKAGTLYTTLLDTPSSSEVTLAALHADPSATVHLLGHDAPLTWGQHGDSLRVMLPNGVSAAPAHALKITPTPQHIGG